RPSATSRGGTIPLVATPASAISPQLPMRRRCSGKPKRPKSPGVHRTGSTPISGPPPPDSWRSLRQATYPQLLHHLKGHDLTRISNAATGMEIEITPEMVEAGCEALWGSGYRDERVRSSDVEYA